MITENKFKDALKRYNELYTEEQKRLAEREAEKQKVDTKYESKLVEIQKSMEKESSTIEQYCQANKNLFEKKKSIRTQFGDIGYRTSPPKINLLEGYSKPSVMEALKKLNSQCVKVSITEDIDKTFVKKLPKEELATCGIEVIQEEIFYIKIEEKVF